MDENEQEQHRRGEQWPPAPDRFRSQQADGAPLTSCPHCRRKLLSTRSILCNWCGKRIDDPEYLERAAHERAMEDARLRDQVEKELDETARLGVLGRLQRKGKTQGRRDNLLIPPE
jgi:hypothetical protein